MLYMFLLWLLIGFGGEWLFWVWIGLVAVLIGFGGEWLFCVWVVGGWWVVEREKQRDRN